MHVHVCLRLVLHLGQEVVSTFSDAEHLQRDLGKVEVVHRHDGIALLSRLHALLSLGGRERLHVGTCLLVLVWKWSHSVVLVLVVCRVTVRRVRLIS